MEPPQRIVVGTQYVRDGSLEFFVTTRSLDAPLVCAADNNGFPMQFALYARAQKIQDVDGIHVSVIFQQTPPSTGKAEFAVNVWQPSMVGPYFVLAP